MKPVAALSVLATAFLLAGCGGEDSSAPAASTTTAPAPASSTVAATSAAAVTADSAEVAQARAAVTAMLGENASAYLDLVNKAWPLTTADRVNTAAGYAIGMCAAKKAGISRDAGTEHVVSDFQREYGITITQAEGEAIVRAAWDTVCV